MAETNVRWLHQKRWTLRIPAWFSAIPLLLTMVIVGLVCTLVMISLLGVMRRGDLADTECRLRRLEHLMDVQFGTRPGNSLVPEC